MHCLLFFFQNWHLLAQKAVHIEDGDGSGGGATGAPADFMSSDEAFLLIQQISANIVSYCQVTMTMGGMLLNSNYGCSKQVLGTRNYVFMYMQEQSCPLPTAAFY